MQQETIPQQANMVPMPRIVVRINEAQFLFTPIQLGSMMFSAIPPYMLDSKMEPPDPMSDLIRQTIKGLAAVMLNRVLFNVYGAAAPRIDKRADKLPVIWRALLDWVIGKAIQTQVVIYASETSTEGIYDVIQAYALPLSPPDAGQVHTIEGRDTGACAECPGESDPPGGPPQ